MSPTISLRIPGAPRQHSPASAAPQHGARRVLLKEPPAVKTRVIGVNAVDNANEARKRQAQSKNDKFVQHQRMQLARHDIVDPKRNSFHDSASLDHHRQQIDQYDIINPTSRVGSSVDHVKNPIDDVDEMVVGTIDAVEPSMPGTADDGGIDPASGDMGHADDPILPRERTPPKKGSYKYNKQRGDDESRQVIVERTSTPDARAGTKTPNTDLLRTPPLRTGGWANLDVLDQVRDLHEHGVNMLERMNETSSEASSEGRKRAEKDAHKLENQVDLLTRQYRDLLNSVSPPVVLTDKGIK